MNNRILRRVCRFSYFGLARLVVVAAVLLGGGEGWGQAGASATPFPPPQAPCVAQPRSGTAWDIAIRYPDDAKKREAASSAPGEVAPKPQRRPISIHGERDQRYTRLVISWSDGGSSEGIIWGNKVILKPAKTGAVTHISTQDEDYLNPYFTKGFSGTAWISLDQYKGVEPIDSKPCYKFVRASAKASSGMNGDAPLPELVAWIRVEDKMPVRVQLGGTVYAYSALRAFNAAIELPTEVAQFLDDVGRQQKALDLMRQKQH